MRYQVEDHETVSDGEILVILFVMAIFAALISGGCFGLIKLASVRATHGTIIIRKYEFAGVKPAFMEKDMALTKKQRDVLSFIKSYKSEFKISPTQREIQEHFKFKSLGSVQDYLSYLEKHGSISFNKNAVRGINLRNECPTCGGLQ